MSQSFFFSIFLKQSKTVFVRLFSSHLESYLFGGIIENPVYLGNQVAASLDLVVLKVNRCSHCQMSLTKCIYVCPIYRNPLLNMSQTGLKAYI